MSNVTQVRGNFGHMAYVKLLPKIGVVGATLDT
jgi:hypothetical protein